MLYAGSFLTVFALTMGLGYTMARDRISIVQRLEHYTEDEKETVYQELAEPLSERVFKPLWNRLMSNIKRAIPQEKAVTYEQKLTLAGYPYGLDAETFVVAKYTVLAVMILGGLFSRSFLMLLILGTLGIIMPDSYLNLCCNRRKDRITRSLPDTLDLLSVSVEAGLGFDAALQKWWRRVKVLWRMNFPRHSMKSRWVNRGVRP